MIIKNTENEIRVNFALVIATEHHKNKDETFTIEFKYTDGTTLEWNVLTEDRLQEVINTLDTLLNVQTI
jgi:hypothetical protein